MSADVATIDYTSAFEAYRAKMANEAETVTYDASAFRRSILGKIAAATSLEEILAAQHVEGSSGVDLVGRTFEINDAVARRSDDKYQTLTATYLIVDAIDTETGEQKVFSIGGETAVATLITIRDTPGLGFPQTLTLRAKTVGAGELLYWEIPPKAVKAAKK
jgi:hypothetical protein